MSSPALPARFVVLETLARSELEILFRARDSTLDREVWLKRPGPAQAKVFKNRDVCAQALLEARALARVQHPAIVRLIDVIETSSGPMLVLEPSPGEGLAERLAREKTLAPREVVRLGVALAGALEALHAAGIVHRGLAGKNVVLGADGSPRLMSASFAKDLAADTLSGSSLSFTYLGSRGEAEDHASQPAPEQTLGKTSDARSDIFGLGWLLYRCLTGAVPFVERDPNEWKVARDPQTLAPETPRELARVLVRALAPSPAKRFASATELRVALLAIEQSLQTPAAAPAAPTATVRKLWPFLVGGVSVLAALVTLWKAFASDAGAAPSRGLAVAEQPPAPGTFSDRYEQSWAVLIGIGRAYGAQGFPVLANAERDVTELAERLDALPKDDWRTAWNVTPLVDEAATRDTILSTVRRIGAQAGENDRLFVYYAGHGEGHEVSSNTGYVIPADAKPLSEDPQRVSWLRFDEFQRIFDETRAKHVLVAMDCCYGGRLSSLRAASASPFMRELLTAKAHVVITSGRPNERVSDGPAGGHSPFASAFLEALAKPGEITSSMLLGFLHERYKAAGETRLPQLGYPEGHPMGGEFVFFGE